MLPIGNDVPGGRPEIGPGAVPEHSGGDDQTVDAVRRLIEEAVSAPTASQAKARPMQEAPRAAQSPAPVAMRPPGHDTPPAPEPPHAPHPGAPDRARRDGRTRARRIAGRLARGALRFLRRPDTPRRIAIVLLVTSVIAAPWFVAGLALLVLALGAITWFSLGPDRASELIAAWFERLSRRDPQKAETLRQRAARTSRLLGAFAARLPKRWTAGLYLPDFEPLTEPPAALQGDPFDRLAAARRADGDMGGH